ncbi:MAG: archaeal proteasome endopeptidase complex subunit beta [Ignisphaera sp.]|nr:archaeal proteasome endopeptidase complex subunit beta [Ignisphaera sp.]MCX8167890.1 archaeal proteasome endopeptidase complex subunit beta [Ignisphaera sp.]MDW8085469.1 archaeal proteasome endopeptidase complex subunit beta [Ignisphaera sp.]
MAYERLTIGATAIGIKAAEGVVVAAEKRISYGGYVVSRVGKKIFRIGDRMVIAAAGLFADMQTLSRVLSAEVMYRELLLSSKMRVRAAAKLLSAILYSYKLMPFLSEIIFAGYDEEGYHLYVLDPIGSIIEDNYAAIGTGAPIAIGVIESEYKNDIPLNTAIEVAIKAIKAAISRDAVSGDGIDIATVDKNGVKERSIIIS